MENNDFLALIEQRLAALESRVDALADYRLTAEVKRALEIARIDQPFALAKARYVLELIVRDIYRRELPEDKPKPLFDMIEALCARKGLFSRKIETDINYIRINGNLIVHAQDEPVEITDRQVEVIVLVTINLVEWYLTGYLPERRGATGEAASLLPLPPNPYRGLLAFREEDAADYFGREPDVTDVLTAVEHQPLVAVVGPSGSGKSSLVYAGVAARLRAVGDWRIAGFRPRGRPQAELAQALVGLWQSEPVERLAQAASLLGHWGSGTIALADTLAETLRQTGGQRLLLIADQFEEIYTLGQEPDATDAFIDLLVQAIQSAARPPDSGQRPSLCLLLTLRADFLGHALGHRGLAAAMDRYPKKLLGPVQDNQRLRAIIEEPAHRAGVALEDLLVERILRDLAQFPGADPEGRGASLPLLEFTLSELWAQQHERRLTHLGYEGLGGIQQALARHADAVYAGFAPAERERVRHVLVQMVRPGEGTEDTRQVAARAQVRPENWPLVTRLADQRLVVTGHDETSGEDTAEIIHEALIRHWQPLREWLREDRAFRLWQNGLRQALAEWERTENDPGALLAGARLAEAEERLGTQAERLGEGEVAYIRASIARREEEVAERERQRLERQRMQRRISFGLAGFLTVALALAGFAGWQWKIANLNQQRAESARALAEAREYAARSEASTDIGAALALAVEAEYRTAEPIPAARLAFARATERLATTIAVPYRSFPLPSDVFFSDVPVFAWSPDGARMAYGNCETVYIVSAETGEIQGAPLTGHSCTTTITWLAGGTRIGTSDSYGLVRLWNTATRAPVAQCLAGPGFKDVPTPFGTERVIGESWGGVGGMGTTVSWSPDGARFASVASDMAVRLWDLRLCKLIATLQPSWSKNLFFHSDVARGVSFSPDGTRIAARGYEGSQYFLLVWDAQSGVKVSASSAFPEAIVSVAWSPDGIRIATGHDNGTVRVWEAGTLQLLETFRGDSARPTRVSWAQRGDLLGVSTYANAAIWDVNEGAKLIPSMSRPGEEDFGQIAWSPDDRFFAFPVKVGTDPGRLGRTRYAIRVWRLTGQGRGNNTLRNDDAGQILSVSWSPDGRQLASGSGYAKAHIWNPLSGKLLRDLSEELHTDIGEIRNVTWSPDGHRLAITSDDGIRIWVLAAKETVQKPWWRSGGVTVIAWSPDGTRIASGFDDGRVEIWDVSTGRPATGRLRRAPSMDTATSVTSIAWAPSGGLFATGGNDGSLQLWDGSTAQKLQGSIQGHDQQALLSLAWAPDSENLVSGYQNGSVNLWRLTRAIGSARLNGSFHADNGSVRSVRWSSDGTRLVSAGDDGSVRFWDPFSRALIAEIPDAHLSSVTSLAWSPDDKMLATSGADGTIRIWSALSEEAACRYAHDLLGMDLESVVGAARRPVSCTNPTSVRNLPPLPVVPAVFSQPEREVWP